MLSFNPNALRLDSFTGKDGRTIDTLFHEDDRIGNVFEDMEGGEKTGLWVGTLYTEKPKPELVIKHEDHDNVHNALVMAAQANYERVYPRPRRMVSYQEPPKAPVTRQSAPKRGNIPCLGNCELAAEGCPTITGENGLFKPGCDAKLNSVITKMENSTAEKFEEAALPKNLRNYIIDNPESVVLRKKGVEWNAEKFHELMAEYDRKREAHKMHLAANQG